MNLRTDFEPFMHARFRDNLSEGRCAGGVVVAYAKDMSMRVTSGLPPCDY